MKVNLRPMNRSDWDSVAAIYRQGIETGNATFEKEIPAWEAWDSAHLKSCRIVAYINSTIVGWAALSPVSGRCVYSGVAEVSVYVSDQYKGQKIGTMLLDQLVSDSEIAGLWTLQASIFPENKASILLHKKMGFRQVGYREKIGKMDSTWRDTILLERRSKVTGTIFAPKIADPILPPAEP
jgi:L-amino acid N-acyltransferase YncA